MKIKKITSQIRRDFTAIFECEHCENTETHDGYDDDFFHRNVIPKMVCVNCQRTSNADYRPLATKYSENQVV
ncbi:hypothetical protein ACG94X_02280 [Acinetobacter sp. ULE_I010]|uniref:hypothetical protein n=1 Tax=Acinetobacter sp. ULE_I010 TaxID=3373065 RepID=UPI003AF7D430